MVGVYLCFILMVVLFIFMVFVFWVVLGIELIYVECGDVNG